MLESKFIVDKSNYIKVFYNKSSKLFIIYSNDAILHVFQFNSCKKQSNVILGRSDTYVMRVLPYLDSIGVIN